MTKLTSEQARAQLADIRAKYAESTKFDNFSALIMGEAGTGKTSIIATGRKPILIDSFDPLNTLVLKELTDKGEVLVRQFWSEQSTAPTEYERWEKQWSKDCDTGFIGMMGTYSIDSCTTWIEALVNAYCKKKGRQDNIPEIQDYQVIYNIIKDTIKISSTQGADFILTGHLVAYQDEVTGRTYSELDIYKRLKTRVPLLFTEKLVTLSKEVPAGIKHVLLTNAAGRYRASTQLGRNGKFANEEEPDIKLLLKKAGLSAEDKVI